MTVYELKVWMEDYPEVTRKIAIGENQTFEELYHGILDSVNFDHTQLASFYICNAQWEKKIEISLIDMNADEGEMIPLMNDTVIGEYISRVDQKVIFEYDFVLMWKFLIEVSAVQENADYDILPVVLESDGIAPDQYETADRYPGELSDDEHRYVEALQKKNAGLFHGDDEHEEDWEEEDNADDPFSDFNDLSGGSDFYDKDDY
jgi:hypothetical protein